MQNIYSSINYNDVEIHDKILSEQDRIVWESMGLTPDVQSMENAALLTKVHISTFIHIKCHLIKTKNIFSR